MWLEALEKICCAQLSEFTVQALECSVVNLNSAVLSLSTPSRSRPAQFMFPLRFAECLSSMYSALRSVLISINTNSMFCRKNLPSLLQKKTSIRMEQFAESKFA
ncbi:unnamed protein product [Gongylonema pulchrum]|uniref:Uncharacterized protein n=1 Tax=Gongylonema pulchrum TaxID=637853 RepID=A0A183DB00_9BILA|nr:unnamed protein product [Gongylonema pulchrum]